jgi:hypothetical protein
MGQRAVYISLSCPKCVDWGQNSRYMRDKMKIKSSLVSIDERIALFVNMPFIY